MAGERSHHGTWEKRLREFGYLKDRCAPGVLSRPAGVRKLSIRKVRTNRAAAGEVAISLDICQPYLGGWAIILQGSLRRNQPPIISVGRGDLWKPDEAEAALAATIEYGLPWLEQYSKPHKLIEYFEDRLRDGVKVEPLKLPAMFSKLSFNAKPSETVRRPPIYNWYLAELYSELSDRDTSVRFAKQYLSSLPDNKSNEEERAHVLSFIGPCDPSS